MAQARRGEVEPDSDQVPEHRQNDLHGLLDGPANLRGITDRGDGSDRVSRLSSDPPLVEERRAIRA